MAIEKLKRHKSSVIGKSNGIFLNHEEEHFVLRSIDLLILFGIKRNCLRIGRVYHCTYS
jgi:hypothetical protein